MSIKHGSFPRLVPNDPIAGAGMHSFVRRIVVSRRDRPRLKPESIGASV